MAFRRLHINYALVFLYKNSHLFGVALFQFLILKQLVSSLTTYMCVVV